MSSASSLSVAKRDIVALEGVTKRFPGVVANDSVDLAIRPGEVHVLLGENGAGKSTLIGMLSGLQQPDEGRILVDGEPSAITSPRHALALGIGTVFQHMMLVPTLTVAENLLLGGPWWQRPKTEELEARVAEITRTLGITVKLHAKVSELSLGEQQQVEILRAMVRNSRLLILDESTSMLTPKGIDELGALMRRLVGQGLAIVFITHKLKEAAAFGDRISVLKLGRKVGEIPPERFRALGEQAIISEIVELMFGKQKDDPEAAERPVRAIHAEAAPLLQVHDLGVAPTDDAPGLSSISFDIRPGELLGIAGIDGNGQKQLAEALAGQRATVGGSVRLQGEPIEALSVGERRRRGLRYLTDDRLGEGTVGTFPVSINFFLKQVGAAPFWRKGVEQRTEIDKRAAQLVREYDVRTPSLKTPVARLSGGNIQKVLLARELAEGAKVVIFNKPTYGLDLANTLASRQRIRDTAARGLAVLLISTDLEELLSMCDRIAVISNGSLVGTVDNVDDARTRVGRLMIGLAA
ncbi:MULTISPECIES: ABC transporter ATP-binding protein [unclassified Mesorhizobium]|uniref:putative B6 ABC transporter ATP-binding protein n=1 Tax=unclassified Mesorhizobium TaxID=325217 RepID=UPI000FD4D556|nr:MULTISPECIES: ABC transporter ATP-binding protein [unclassified Mesorhizobium]RVB76534.1 ABC transporter ATP-binding protein [Mesorhizobium sp. M6A.T.Cr.TU.014.01.1.1]RWP80573.1 MAG: ABC transporter ATP-binding protein [Mesorhizobium sp.]RWQ02752.1 MAG: ABC transporter ATP-binding protein [Mesorhizobium sp.]RWQ08390.1 MAG: ABC transporter ATP-binding protein [Mesorhizobium sp.]